MAPRQKHPLASHLLMSGRVSSCLSSFTLLKMVQNPNVFSLTLNFAVCLSPMENITTAGVMKRLLRQKIWRILISPEAGCL